MESPNTNSGDIDWVILYFISMFRPAFFPHAVGAGIVSFLVSYLALNFHFDTYSTIMSIHKQLVKRDGISTTWYKNGQKKAEENCKNGKLISVMVWKPNGQRCPETNVNKGTGVLIEYDENGQKMKETQFENGSREGTAYFWSPDGSEQVELLYQTDIEWEGTWKSWYAAQRPQKEIVYREGKIISHREWALDGTLVVEKKEASQE